MAQIPKIGCINTILITIGVVWLMSKFDGHKSANPPPTPEVSRAESEGLARSVSAISQAKEAVKGVLKAPSTADFEWLPETRHDAAEQLYSVTGHVDAQNGFGAQIRNDYFVVLQRLCGDTYRANCWQVLKLVVGDQIYIDREYPKSAPTSSTGPKSETTAPASAKPLVPLNLVPAQP